MRHKNDSSNDDVGDMDSNGAFSERDFDALVAGRVTSDPALAPLRGVLVAMKTSLAVEPDEQHVTAFGAQLASVAAAATRVAEPVKAPASVRQNWRRRLGAVVAVSAIPVLGFAGAAAADEAAPGDLLYSFDQALESVGLLDGGMGERLDEAQVLLDEGSVDEAISHTIDALDEAGDEETATALRRAALSVASQSSGDDVRARVSTMLQWMAGEETRGQEFGAAVSEFARTLSGKVPSVPGNNGGEGPAGPGHDVGVPAAPAAAGSNGNAPEVPGNEGSAPGAPDPQGAKPETPGDAGKAPETPGSNGNAPDGPGNQGKAPETPGKAPETPGKAPETPGADKGKP